MSESFAGKTALVTGASRGIGRAVSLALAARGANVIMVARSTTGLTAVDDEIRKQGHKATLVPIDLQNTQTVGQMCSSILERFGGLDILVGNAGLLGGLTPISAIDGDKWNEMLMVNVTANLVLMQAMEAALRAAPAGRAVFVSSGASQSCKAFWGSYASTKAALDALVSVWAKEQKGTNLKINLVDPGPTRTAMRRDAYPGEDAQTLKPADALVPLFMKLLDPSCPYHGQRLVADEWLKTADANQG